MKLAAVFSDNAVLQRDLPIKVWGWTEPGELVSVTLAGHSAEATAGADGAWRVELPALPAGGPHEMTVSGMETITLRNLLVGEVWVCSGQSNMQWPLSQAMNAEQEIAEADYPQIRLFSVPNVLALEPTKDIQAEWKLCAPETVPSFSAVGYFYGRELHKALGVPIGLINTSWGGTLAESWTSREGLLAEESLHCIIEELDEAMPDIPTAWVKYEQMRQIWQEAANRRDGENLGYPQGWADPYAHINDWGTMLLPAIWEARGLRMNGVIWFRKEVEIPAEWAGKDLTLSLGTIDKSDATYFNNVKVGGITLEDREDSWNVRRIYTVPGELVQPGRAVIATRIFSQIWAGGIAGKADELYLTPVGETGGIALDGNWRYKIEANFGNFTEEARPMGPGNPNTPTVLYNGMIYPLLPYVIRGAIWYQGESNAGRPIQYRTLFPAMIRDWRKRWEVGDFPFYFVQLANFLASTDAGAESNWAELREAQTMALSLPNTGMAVIIDIGETSSIHPLNKQEVGRRLALNALAKTYGQPVTFSGPLYREAKVENGALRVAFDYAEGGLVSTETRLSGFLIAGADRKFYPADAVIDGETVVVSSPQVKAPVAVRYGWADDPTCTLYNQAGLPASPFRTDAWAREMATAGV